MLMNPFFPLAGRAQDVPFADVNVELGCNWVQGLGTNPINQLALKYKLRTAVTDGDDVVFYGEKGKINATERYNDMNNYYEIMSEDASMSPTCKSCKYLFS